MSGIVRRRQSKWDNKNSEDLPETLHDRGPLSRHREPSPNRSLWRHDNRSKERVITSDRAHTSSRVSPALDEGNNQHRSRSPRNGWGQSHRGSRSRSRSQSPAHHLRRELALNDRSRSRSRVSAQICRDFSVGRCRRGDHCQFLHQNDQSYDRRRPSECSPPDDREGRHQRTGGSRSSPPKIKDSDSKAEKSMHVCKEFLKGKCRGGASCRYVHHETVADALEKEPIDDVRRHVVRERDRVRDRDNGHTTRDTSHRNYDREPADVSERDRNRDRNNDCRNRDTYRNHDRESRKRGEIFCKFFAAGNCKSGNHCRFSHVVQQRFSPETRSQYDTRGTDVKLESGQVWDGPRWSDVPPISNVPQLQAWIDEKKEVTIATEQVPAANPADDLWIHDRLVGKDAWATTDEILTQAENSSLQGKAENNVLGMGLSSLTVAEFTSNDRDNSSRNISFGPGQQDAVGFTTYEKPYLGGCKDHELYNDAFTVQNFDHKEDKPTWYHGGGRNVTVNHDGSSILQSPTLNTTTYQGFSQNQPSVNEHTSSRSPAGQTQVPLQPSEGGRIQESHVPSVFTNATTADRSHHMNAPLSGHASAIATSPDGLGQTQISLEPSEGGKMQESLGPSVFVNTAAADSPHFLYATSSENASASSISHAVQGQTPFSFPSVGGRLGESHDPSIVIDTSAADGPHLFNATLSGHTSSVAGGLGGVSSEQLVQLSHLSASLAQLIESRQKLPALSSNITSPGTTKFPDTVAPVPPALSSIIQPNQALELSKQQYDPICDSIEPKVQSQGDFMFPCDVEQKNTNVELNNEGDKANQLEPVATTKGDENMDKAIERSSKAPGNKASQDMPVEDGADDDKKSKDTKAIRPFKFALAEFVKEILKPSWKDGQVNKDSYKVIVKKVVDKIIDTQGLQIPQSKEKIDQYLSSSKPKIEKLVQAYVGRYQKK